MTSSFDFKSAKSITHDICYFPPIFGFLNLFILDLEGYGTDVWTDIHGASHMAS